MCTPWDRHESQNTRCEWQWSAICEGLYGCATYVISKVHDFPGMIWDDCLMNQGSTLLQWYMTFSLLKLWIIFLRETSWKDLLIFFLQNKKCVSLVFRTVHSGLLGPFCVWHHYACVCIKTHAIPPAGFLVISIIIQLLIKPVSRGWPGRTEWVLNTI